MGSIHIRKEECVGTGEPLCGSYGERCAATWQEATCEYCKHGLDREFLARVGAEVVFARRKFPNNAHMLAALTEEVGELARALLEGEGKARIRAEAIQVACVALRIATEGDADFQHASKEPSR